MCSSTKIRERKGKRTGLSALQFLQKILNLAAVKRPHRFLGQAAHLLRSPILFQVLAILGKGLQLPTTCNTQSQPRCFAGTIIREAT
jgi:hypothetical protein